MDWLNILISRVHVPSCDSKSCYKLVFVSHTTKIKKKKKKKYTRVPHGICRKDLTTCNYNSTICVHLSPEVVKVEYVQLAQEPV